jgi:hypothetical protein
VPRAAARRIRLRVPVPPSRLQGAFQEIMQQIELPIPAPRTFAPTALQIEAARKAGPCSRKARRALLHALVYDTTGRTFDFLGKWLPISDKKPSAVIA